jgi:hypothetical protein
MHTGGGENLVPMAESNNAIGSISVSGVQASNNDRLVGHFTSENVFNLSHKILSETEIRVLSKGLQFLPTSFKIDEVDLRKDFNEFSRRMRNKWHLRDNATADFSEIPAFRPKSTWTPPKGCPSLELFLSQIEKELFEYVPQKLRKHNLSKIEWLALKTLIEDNSIVIKPADKGSCVVVWGRDDYLAEGYSQLSENNVYTKMEIFSEETVTSLTEESNNMFHKLYNQGCISKDEFKYISRTILKIRVHWGGYIFYLRFIKGFEMYQGVLLSLIVGLLQKGPLNS